MGSGPEQQQQWHPSVALGDFVHQVSSLQQIVDMTKTSKLGSFDNDTIKRVMGWGSYIEEVIGTLSTEWHRDALARELHRSIPHVATLSHLHQARRWVLASMLGSAFLGDHPKPEALLLWIMTEYAALPGGEASLRRERSRNDGGLEYPGSLNLFIDDATEVVASRGHTATLSHACSTLLVCTDAGTEQGTLPRDLGLETSASCTGDRSRLLESLTSALLNAGKTFPVGSKGRRPPSLYELSVETAQKRAYANNCYNVLLTKGTRDDGLQERGRPEDASTSFIAQMTTTARADIVVMEVMCLMLLEPWRRAMYSKGRPPDWVHGPDSAAVAHSQDTQLRSMVTTAMLEQVLTFRDDARLWSLDAWLLAEISHYYFRFADVYLAHMLTTLNQLAQEELDEGFKTSGDFLAARIKSIRDRLHALSSRSKQLEGLCHTVLAHSALAQRT